MTTSCCRTPSPTWPASSRPAVRSTPRRGVAGVTIYLPDGRASLHPPRLAEDAASLLPDVERPAVVFTVRVDPAGGVRLDGAERSVIRSRAKLAYSTVTLADLPAAFVEFAARIERAEIERGAERVEAPEQEVARTDDGFELRFRPRSDIEEQSAALSLATNMAVADALYAARTGLFRTMEGVDEAHAGRLRQHRPGVRARVAEAAAARRLPANPARPTIRAPARSSSPSAGRGSGAVRAVTPTASFRGTPRSPRRTATRRRRCVDWPTAT